jgi:hypothetical protein
LVLVHSGAVLSYERHARRVGESVNLTLVKET